MSNLKSTAFMMNIYLKAIITISPAAVNIYLPQYADGIRMHLIISSAIINATITIFIIA